MILFLIGLMVGGFIGIMVSACLAAAHNADEKSER